jgi:type VI secretion system secreted protein VgrG
MPAYSTAFIETVNRTILFEGGLADRGAAADRGGLTNLGITQATATRYGIHDVRTLTKEQALLIYHEEYWVPCQLDRIPDGELQRQIFDFAVTSGPARAVRALQRAWNVLFTPYLVPLKEDGVLGPLTLASVSEKLPKYDLALRGAYRGERYSFYKKIWETDPEYASQNIRGWAKRL